MLETAKLEFHARRVHDLVKQASSMAAGRWVSTDTKRELDGGRAKQDASGLSSTRRRRKHKAEFVYIPAQRCRKGVNCTAIT